MPARKGKKFCSTYCRVTSARYDNAWKRYVQAASEMERFYDRVLTQRKLLKDGT